MPNLIEPPGFHRVYQGEWISKLARWYGIPSWHLIWNHPENQELRTKRKTPNILLPGDLVYIPARTPKAVTRSVDRLHKFRVTSGLIPFLLTLYDENKQPRPHVPYGFRVDQGPFAPGRTDDTGVIREKIPPDAETLFLEVDDQVIEINLGHLDPLEEVTGIQARLSHLGYDPGEIDGVYGPRTAAAVRAFQRDCTDPKLKVDGICGPKTRDALKKYFGS